MYRLSMRSKPEFHSRAKQHYRTISRQLKSICVSRTSWFIYVFTLTKNCNWLVKPISVSQQTPRWAHQTKIKWKAPMRIHNRITKDRNSIGNHTVISKVPTKDLSFSVKIRIWRPNWRTIWAMGLIHTFIVMWNSKTKSAQFSSVCSKNTKPKPVC